jgi:hypothetical protein
MGRNKQRGKNRTEYFKRYKATHPILVINVSSELKTLLDEVKGDHSNQEVIVALLKDNEVVLKNTFVQGYRWALEEYGISEDNTEE